MADASKMSVEHAAITSHVQSLQQHNQSLQQDSSKFMEAIAPLESVWKGMAVGSWQQMTQAWSEFRSDRSDRSCGRCRSGILIR